MWISYTDLYKKIDSWVVQHHNNYLVEMIEQAETKKMNFFNALSLFS